MQHSECKRYHTWPRYTIQTMGNLFSSTGKKKRKKKHRLLPADDAKKPAKRQRVIHISGSPGSGKTFLLESIRRALPETVALVDTDTLIIPMFESKEWKKCKSDAERGRYYAKEATRRIKAFIDERDDASGIVLAGLTMYWAWSPDAGGFDKGEAFPADIEASHAIKRTLVFIDIDTKTLIQQRYKRDVEDVVQNKQDDLLSGKISIDFSADMIRNYARVEKQTFVDDLGYRLESQDAIRDRVIRLLS